MIFAKNIKEGSMDNLGCWYERNRSGECFSFANYS